MFENKWEFSSSEFHIWSLCCWIAEEINSVPLGISYVLQAKLMHRAIFYFVILETKISLESKKDEKKH
jgi:hypothetical protein